MDFVITALNIYTFCFKISKHLEMATLQCPSLSSLVFHMAAYAIFLQNKPNPISSSIGTSIVSLFSIKSLQTFLIEPSKSTQFLSMYSQDM